MLFSRAVSDWPGTLMLHLQSGLCLLARTKVSMILQAPCDDSCWQSNCHGVPVREVPCADHAKSSGTSINGSAIRSCVVF